MFGHGESTLTIVVISILKIFMVLINTVMLIFTPPVCLMLVHVCTCVVCTDVHKSYLLWYRLTSVCV